MALRVLLTFFSGVVATIAAILIPVAYFGDKNLSWTNRLIWIAFVGALIFVAALLW